MKKLVLSATILAVVGWAQVGWAVHIPGVDDANTLALWKFDDPSFNQQILHWPKVTSTGGSTFVMQPDDDSNTGGTRDHHLTLGSVSLGFDATRRPTIAAGTGVNGTAGAEFKCCTLQGSPIATPRASEAISRITDPAILADPNGDGFDRWWTDSLNEFTVDFWYKNPSHGPQYTGDTEHIEFIMGKASTWEVTLLPGGTPDANGNYASSNLRLTLWHSNTLTGGAVVGNTILTMPGMELDTWYHVTAGYTGSAPFMHVEGVNTPLTYTDTRPAGQGAFLQGTNGNVQMGNKNGTNRFFSGFVDQIHIFNIVVPEPTSISLVALGCVPMILFGRKRRNAV